MKKSILFYLLLFVGTVSSGQSTFNVRLNLGYPVSTMSSIISTDSCYYVTGTVVDTILPPKLGTFFSKFSLDGELQFVKTITRTGENIANNEPTLRLNDVGNFTLIVVGEDPLRKIIFIQFNAQGDTLFTKEHRNLLYPTENFIYPVDVVIDNEYNSYIVTNIHEGPSGDDQHLSVLKLNNEGDLVWHYPMGDPTWDDHAGDIIATNDGNILVSSSRSNLFIHPQDFFSQVHLVKIDTSGQIMEEILTPMDDKLRYRGKDILGTLDGGYLIASGIGTEYANGMTHYIRWEKLFVKLNAQGEIEWEKEFRSPYPIGMGLVGGLNKIVAATDGSGYLGVSSSVEDLPGDNTFTYRGWLGKISNEGDSLWTREYVVVDSDDNIHLLYDLKATSDGGYIMCGSAEDDTADTLQTQAWLLKVDEYGCLVPDCNITPVDEPNATSVQLSIYPNPTTDYLNIHHYSRTYQSARFQIVNTLGQVVKEFAASGNDLTTIVPVWSFPTGQYYLQYIEEGNLLYSKGFMIIK